MCCDIRCVVCCGVGVGCCVVVVSGFLNSASPCPHIGYLIAASLKYRAVVFIALVPDPPHHSHDRQYDRHGRRLHNLQQTCLFVVTFGRALSKQLYLSPARRLTI